MRGQRFKPLHYFIREGLRVLARVETELERNSRAEFEDEAQTHTHVESSMFVN